MIDTSTTQLEGRIERITFRSDDTHFMIAKFRVAQNQSMVTVLGHMPESRPGEILRLKGNWSQHPRYGQQFKVQQFEVLLPADVDEIRRYLYSGMIQGIGPKTADRLIAHFQKETLSVIEQQPQRLAEVKGIGRHKADRIHQAWQAHHGVHTLMKFLQDHDIKPAYAAKVYKTYGPDAIRILRHDPYQVAADIPRIGFYIADAVVRQSDLPIDEAERAAACIRHLLWAACDKGHSFVAGQALESRCAEAFELDYGAVQSALDHLNQAGEIVIDTDAPHSPVYLAELYHAEVGVAQRLGAMLTIPVRMPRVDSDTIMAAVVQRLAITLSDRQMQVLQSVFQERVVIITGGPGTGKTTLIRAIAALFDAMGRLYCLAAPTGRAARRMAEVTRRSAATVHKLLGYNLAEGHFEHDQDNPLDTEALIVDEASMVDLPLMVGIVKALPHGAVLILVGDEFQLPSVGPGTVLADLINSRAVKTFGLEKVYRQADKSPIIANAHKVRQGELPQLPALAQETPLTEFSFIEQSDPQKVARTIVTLCADVIPNQLGLDPVRDLQVLTPMHKGALGTIELNRKLQAALNPRQGNPSVFGLGDKVMHLRNNYSKEVFNGEIGTVCQAGGKDVSLKVAYEKRQVVYDDADLDELTLAYAISVHKSQGSEYPVVILPLVTQHYVMLQRNLLYTALTRAQKMVIVIGSPKAVRIAVQTDPPRWRQSLLAWRLNPDMYKEWF